VYDTQTDPLSMLRNLVFNQYNIDISTADIIMNEVNAWTKNN